MAKPNATRIVALRQSLFGRQPCRAPGSNALAWALSQGHCHGIDQIIGHLMLPDGLRRISVALLEASLVPPDHMTCIRPINRASAPTTGALTSGPPTSI